MPLPGVRGRTAVPILEFDAVSVHLPDLDDVFLALTGQPDKERATLP